jgi:archaellum biogenesis protein FlaJ (TadC family)
MQRKIKFEMDEIKKIQEAKRELNTVTKEIDRVNSLHADWREKWSYLFSELAETEKKDTFEEELERLINKYSMENGSDTPDFILALYIMDCLNAFNKTVRERESWYHTENNT